MATSGTANVATKARLIIDEVERVIVGKRTTVEFSLMALLCRGHLLIEDIPGVGKTMLAKSLARALGMSYKRVQFTPDLLPADITGISIYNQKTAQFEFRPGPVFTNVLLADEINRATPKAQSSLLECMEEFQVTVDGTTRSLATPFFVIATENPIEYHGTYPLPEAQLDRFLLRVNMGYPSHDEEITVMERQILQHPIETVQPVATTEDVLEMQTEIRRVHLEDSLKEYIVRLVEASRRHPLLALGASPRASLALMRCSQARAAIQGREFVTPDDIKPLALPVLGHRIIPKAEARPRGISPADVVQEIVQSVPIP
jgi:MoxR-like ATPase